MKKIIRNTVVVLLFSPLIALIYLTMVFTGKDRAIVLWGPFLTFLAKQSLRFWVPEIKHASDFDSFPARMKSNFRLWRPFYDFEVTEETSDTFKLHIWNCPFCEVLNAAGLSELGPYMCKADWAKADENRDKWLFERKHQIGTGDRFCDHTYKRKNRA